MSVARIYGKKATKRKQDDAPEYESPKKQRIDAPAPASPPKLARDLSHIFDEALSPSRPVTPTKLAKRMLGRSKTETSIESTSDSPSSSRSLADRTSSLPSFPSPSKPLSKAPSLSHPTTEQTQTSPQRPAITNKRTYAGRSRSFLVPLPADPSQAVEDDFLNRESYAALRSRWGVDNSEDDPYPEVVSPIKSNTTTPSGSPTKGKGKGRLKQEPVPPADIIKPMKSITEIRNKGENRRFLDEVGYLLEGMGKDETPALRKASALEIVSRLCESDFTRQAKAADFLQSCWDAFIEAGGGKGEDKVLDVLLAFFSALVARDLGSLTDLAQRDPSPSSSTSSNSIFISTIFSLLSNLSPDTDPLLIISRAQTISPDGQLKKLGIKIADRSLLKTLHATILSKSHLFSARTPISSALLLTRTLSSLPSSLIPCACIPSLLSSLRAQLQPASQSLTDLSNSNTKPASSSANSNGRHSKPKLSSSGSPSSSKKHKFAPSSLSSELPPSSSSSNALQLEFESESISFTAIHDLLILLDGYLLGQWAPCRYAEQEQEKYLRLLDVARDEWLASGLVGAGIAAELATCALQDKDKTRNMRTGNGSVKSDVDSLHSCTEIVFRVLVSLTHSDPLWGQALARDVQAVTFIVRTIVRADAMRRQLMHMDWGSASVQPKSDPRSNGTGKSGNGKNGKNGLGKGNGKGKGAIKIKKEEDLEDADLDVFLSTESDGDDDDGVTRRKRKNGEAEAKESTVNRSQISAARALDRLCLALGLLTNLVQVVDDSKRMLRETNFDPECIEKTRPCIHACTCPNPVSVLHVLVQVYHHQLRYISVTATAAPSTSITTSFTNTRAKHRLKTKNIIKSEPGLSPPQLPSSPHDRSNINADAQPNGVEESESEQAEAEADASFLLGHLSVLFGLLMMDSPENQEIVLDVLPMLEHPHTDVDTGAEVDVKPSHAAPRKQKLGQLVENASEIGVFYAVISRRGLAGAEHGDGGEGRAAGDVGEPTSATGGRSESDATRGADVAREVILFLTRLRDSL